MAVAGELRTMELPDLLQWVAGRARTGTLRLERRATHKRLGFRDGRLRSSWSNDPREMLGQHLVREELVTEEQLFTALLRQEKEKGRLLGELLVESGALAADKLRSALAACAREAIYGSFLWTEGRFEFKEETAGVPEGIDLDTVAIIAEGSRRAREWQRIRQRLPSSEVTFRPLQAEPEMALAQDRIAYRLACEGRSLADISLQMRLSEFAAGERLFRLCEQGLLEANAEAETAAATDVVGAIQALLAEARARLLDGRLSAAQDAYENVLGLDSLNAEARRGLTEVAQGRERARVAVRVPLEGVPVLRLSSFALTQQQFDPQEAFVLSRVNGQWDIRSILKLCPMREEDALLIFSRLLDRQAIELH